MERSSTVIMDSQVRWDICFSSPVNRRIRQRIKEERSNSFSQALRWVNVVKRRIVLRIISKDRGVNSCVRKYFKKLRGSLQISRIYWIHRSSFSAGVQDVH